MRRRPNGRLFKQLLYLFALSLDDDCRHADAHVRRQRIENASESILIPLTHFLEIAVEPRNDMITLLDMHRRIAFEEREHTYAIFGRSLREEP